MLRKEAVGGVDRKRTEGQNGCRTDGKEIWINRGNGKLFPFLFLFPSIPLYVGGGGGEACLSRERGEILVDPKKHLRKGKYMYDTKTLDIPPRSRAQIGV